MTNRKCISERGSSVIGLTVLAPVMAVLLFFVIAAGRVGVIESRLITASHGAARAAAQQRSTSSALAVATELAEASLAQSKITCQGGPRVRVWEMDLQPGGRVRMQVSCDVRLSDLSIPGLPGSMTVSAAATSIVDHYRSGGI